MSYLIHSKFISESNKQSLLAKYPCPAKDQQHYFLNTYSKFKHIVIVFGKHHEHNAKLIDLSSLLLATHNQYWYT